jgi:hypothetical protein
MDVFEDKTGMKSEVFLEYRSDELAELLETGSITLELMGVKYEINMEIKRV